MTVGDYVRVGELTLPPGYEFRRGRKTKRAHVVPVGELGEPICRIAAGSDDLPSTGMRVCAVCHQAVDALVAAKGDGRG